MRFCVGLDMGVASVGWAVMECDEYGEPHRIVDLGARVFEKAEQPKTGASLAKPRRDKRDNRRRLRRRANRLIYVREMFYKEFGKDTFKDVDNSHDDVYCLRVKGLDEKLSPQELYKILVYYAKHRGYKSVSKSEDEKKDNGKLLGMLKDNSEYLTNSSYRTLGEMLYKDSKYSFMANGKKVYNTRNHDGEYTHCFYREDIKNEIIAVCSRQKEFGLINDEFVNKYLQAFDYQHSYDVGPEEPSPYRIDRYPVKDCSYESGEKVAPKSSFTFEYFTALQKINNVKILGHGDERPLTPDERQLVINTVIGKSRYTFTQLRKLLKLNSDEYFNLVNYSQKGKTAEETETKTGFVSFAHSSEIQKALSDTNKNNYDLIDELSVILSNAKTDENRRNKIALSEICACLTNEEISALLSVNCKTFGSLSFKAMRKLIPVMERGVRYDAARIEVGYDSCQNVQNQKYKTLHGDEIKNYIDGIGSPVVRRSVSQTVKVLNAIIDKYGSPSRVNVELARELSKTFEERQKITRNNKENEDHFNTDCQMLQSEHGILCPTPKQVQKYRLYQEQHGKCAYSGKTLDLERVLSDDKYCEIDHILPYSRSFDDSWSNKVLVTASENQNKKCRTPFEYFGNDKTRWENFVTLTESNYTSNTQNKKKQNLLREKFTEDNSKEWKSRALNDTRYATSFMFNLINDYLELQPIKDHKKQVTAVNGRITDYMRKTCGLQKVRSDGDKHHALDAVVIACVSDGNVKRITEYNKIKESRMYWDDEKRRYLYANEDGEPLTDKDYDLSHEIDRQPYSHFRDELLLRLSDNVEYEKNYNTGLLIDLGYSDEEIDALHSIFVSRMPERKAKGAIHQDTILSAKRLSEGKSLKKVSITKLKLTKDKSAIDGYDERSKQDDKVLYDALYERLLAFDGDAEKAFKDGFYKPATAGKQPNPVKKVFIEEKFNVGFKFIDKNNSDKVRSVADNGSIVRTDVFTKNGKYYCVPVYLQDIYAKRLPNKAITAGKDYSEWTEMDETYEFLFSLFKNDVVYIKNKIKPESDKNKSNTDKEGYFYYNSIDSSNSRIKIKTHDGAYSARVGMTTLPVVKKYVVDLFGNLNEVKKEKRLNSEWLI